MYYAALVMSFELLALLIIISTHEKYFEAENEGVLIKIILIAEILLFIKLFLSAARDPDIYPVFFIELVVCVILFFLFSIMKTVSRSAVLENENDMI